jgi:hypothetical protein
MPGIVPGGGASSARKNPCLVQLNFSINQQVFNSHCGVPVNSTITYTGSHFAEKLIKRGEEAPTYPPPPPGSFWKP